MKPVSTKMLVISLDEADERRRTFTDGAKRATIDWAFMSAHTCLHSPLKYLEEDAIVAWGRPLHARELAVYSSHYAAWECLTKDQDADQYVILEDDIIVDWIFMDALANTCLSGQSIEYLRLYYKIPRAFSVIKRNFIVECRDLIELRGLVVGAQGYVVTKAGARTLMKHCQKVLRPIDVEMDRSWAHGLRNLSVFPFPIIETSVMSTIGAGRYQAFAVPPELAAKRWAAKTGEWIWMEAGQVYMRLRSKLKRRIDRARQIKSADSVNAPPGPRLVNTELAIRIVNVVDAEKEDVTASP